MNRQWLIFTLIILCAACGIDMPDHVKVAYADLPAELDYNIHIRPILSDKCFACHGPDANTRMADMRLDIESEAKAALKNGHGRAIVSGSAGRSLMVERMLETDPELSMPPPEANNPLSDREKAMLIKWIDDGAPYKEHWAFSAPVAPAIPVLAASKSKNDIDLFIARTLETNGFDQSDVASKERLLRRATMDITGLPPSIAEIDDFLNDTSDDAYETAIDRLISSRAYGERMAMEWMDVSRYADSHGLHADGSRMMWPWRDWVIDAFNSNQPYDEFVTWQLAGDLMPDATYEQKLATAFNRNHTMTAEGGAIDEEFRLSYVFDRTETFGTAFLGLTVGCAKCHDHKFDPISQKEYYELTAFFNNIKDLGMTGDDGNYGPMLPVMTMAEEASLKTIENEIANQRSIVETTKEEVAAVKSFVDQMTTSAPVADRFFYGQLERQVIGANKPNTKKVIDGNQNFYGWQAPTTLVEGIKGKAADLTGEYDNFYVKMKELRIEAYDELSASLWINTTKRDSAKTQTLLGNTGEKNSFWRGWEWYLDENNYLNIRLINSLPHNYIHVRSLDSLKVNQWNHVGFSYDGSATGNGIQLYLNGEQLNKKIEFDQLYKSIYPIKTAIHTPDDDRAVTVGRSGRAYTGESGNFIGKIDEIKLFKRELSALEMHQAAALLEKESSASLKQDHKIANAPAVKAAKEKVRQAIKKKIELYNEVEEVMVMEEMTAPRPTFMYMRGEYDVPTDQVGMNTPAALPSFDGYPKNRYGLAQWLTDEDNPLFARVTVNRYWQMLFGKGLVNTSNDFGLQGSLPSHPELLDYLAIAFAEHDYDIKWLIKEMVMSHTYQQSSKIKAEHRESDPDNILLARAPSFRLPAEMIRDNALAASGLLVQNEGGESVKPYQPKGLWIEKTSFSKQLLTYKETKGDSLYRRSLYTFIRRTQPHPAMVIFDAPSREVCTIKRENTSTPLQALVLLNDPQFVEAARVMAERCQIEGGDKINDQIQLAFRLSTGRKATDKELDILTELYNKQHEKYGADRQAAKAFIAVGDYDVANNLDPARTAALAAVTSTIINHNESYMKR